MIVLPIVAEAFMAKASRSGKKVRPDDVPVVRGMVARGDRRHDIAAWFGFNQGRIAEIEEGQYGSPLPAHQSTLPPAGSPGPKALAIRAAVAKAISALEAQSSSGSIVQALKVAAARFDKDE